MVSVLLPAQLVQEMTSCAVLGAAIGVLRAFFPVRGRGAFAPDVLLSGAVLLGCQSYAAGYSAAGVLRWYMVVSAFAAALTAAGVLGIPVRGVEQLLVTVLCLPGRCMAHFVVRPLHARRARHKLRRNAERTAKKSKKNLPNRQAVLYNSNVSK